MTVLIVSVRCLRIIVTEVLPVNSACHHQKCFLGTPQEYRLDMTFVRERHHYSLTYGNIQNHNCDLIGICGLVPGKPTALRGRRKSGEQTK